MPPWSLSVSGMRGICSRSSSWQVGWCPMMNHTGHRTHHIQPIIVSGAHTVTFAITDTHLLYRDSVWSKHGRWLSQMHWFTIVKEVGRGRVETEETDWQTPRNWNANHIHAVCHNLLRSFPIIPCHKVVSCTYAIIETNIKTDTELHSTCNESHTCCPTNSYSQHWHPAATRARHDPTANENLFEIKKKAVYCFEIVRTAQISVSNFHIQHKAGGGPVMTQLLKGKGERGVSVCVVLAKSWAHDKAWLMQEMWSESNLFHVNKLLATFFLLFLPNNRL